MIEVKRIATIAAVAGAALIGGAAPASSQPVQTPPPVSSMTYEVPSVQDCTVLVATASGKNQGCSSALLGGVIGTYHLDQGEGEDGRRLVMTCTMLGGVGTPDPANACHHTLLGGLIKGD